MEREAFVVLPTVRTPHMGSSILKWLAALGTGCATAALAWLGQHTGTGPSVDPLVAGLLAGAMSKLIGWLTSKVPATP
jgi:hypothetical protein